jgi:hypothetical protein
MSEKLSLPSVTLACVDSVNIPGAISSLEICTSRCDFGAVKFFTHANVPYEHRVNIPRVGSLNDYSAFVLKELWKHIGTPHVLIVQWDGWILNPESWRPHWLSFDYIGSLFMQEREINSESVGVGGFCLRSHRLMRAASDMLPPWDGETSYDWSEGNNWGHEDGVLSKYLRRPLLNRGMRFAPPREAAVFCQGGNPDPEYQVERPFGFHKLYRNIDLENCTVAPYDDPPQNRE